MDSKKIMFSGFILMIAGTTSFSNHELLGDIITLIGSLTILGVCIFSGYKKRIRSS